MKSISFSIKQEDHFFYSITCSSEYGVSLVFSQSLLMPQKFLLLTCAPVGLERVVRIARLLHAHNTVSPHGFEVSAYKEEIQPFRSDRLAGPGTIGS